MTTREFNKEILDSDAESRQDLDNLLADLYAQAQADKEEEDEIRRGNRGFGY